MHTVAYVFSSFFKYMKFKQAPFSNGDCKSERSLIKSWVIKLINKIT